MPHSCQEHQAKCEHKEISLCEDCKLPVCKACNKQWEDVCFDSLPRWSGVCPIGNCD